MPRLSPPAVPAKAYGPARRRQSRERRTSLWEAWPGRGEAPPVPALRRRHSLGLSSRDRQGCKLALDDGMDGKLRRGVVFTQRKHARFDLLAEDERGQIPV